MDGKWGSCPNRHCTGGRNARRIQSGGGEIWPISDEVEIIADCEDYNTPLRIQLRRRIYEKTTCEDYHNRTAKCSTSVF